MWRQVHDAPPDFRRSFGYSGRPSSIRIASIQADMMNAIAKQPFPIADTGAALKEAMRHLVGGVTVITAGTGEERTGLTVTSATSLSVEPPTMIVCVNRSASSWPVIQRHRHFVVNILAAHHQPVADRFAGRGGVKGVERYAQARWRTLATGALALEDALAAIDCEVEEIIERHSHGIIIGAVRALTIAPAPTDPLVYGRGRYGVYASA
jgi:flavin reductase (DIM6/NTAB) family NADH-FMN oxidoreductase RutF